MAQVKGTQIADLVQAMAGLSAQGALVVPDHLQRYLDDTILASSWYPEHDFRDMMLLVGRAVQATVDGNVWRYLGKMGAARDSAGLYANWVRSGDPERTLRYLGQGWSAVRDSGRLTVTIAGPKHAEVVVRLYPVMCPELAETNAGYIEELLRATGARDVEAQVREITAGGARWKVTWR